MNSMKKLKITAKDLNAPLCEFFFQMVYICPVNEFIFVVANFLEKLLIIAPPLVLVFSATDWSAISQVARCFIPITQLSSQSTFDAISIVAFAVLQTTVAAGVYYYLQVRYQLSHEDYRAPYSASFQLFHTFVHLIVKLLVPVSASFLAYYVRILLDQSAFSDYKQIFYSSPTSTYTYISLAFNVLSFAEIFGLSLAYSILGQDRSLRGVTFWGNSVWYSDVAKILASIVGQANFVLSKNTGDDALDVVVLLMWIGCTGMMVWLVRWKTMWVGLVELHFCSMMVMVQAFVALCNVFKLIRFADHSQYVLIFPVYAFVICLIRYLLTINFVASKPKNEREALTLLAEFIDLARAQDRHSYSKLAAFLNIHSDSCTNPACECKETQKAIWKRTENIEFKTNTRAYISSYEKAGAWQKGCINKVLRLVLGDLEPCFTRSDAFCVLLAEVYFYWLANFYYSWELISIVRQRKPSFLLRQRMYNLSRVIHNGMACYEDEDLERTTEAIDYLKYYNSFIEKIEEASEMTVKFWTLLLNDRPSSQRLNELGKALFDSKYEIMKVVKEISRITSNQVDFLVRYGLFMKYVMHDTDATEQAFKKIYHTQESSSFTHSRRFSIFRGDVRVMLVVGSLGNSKAATISETNNETEKRLGYSREELLGSPVTNLMSPTISRCHDRLVQKFFRTMSSHHLNTPRLRFIKKSDGTYMACETFKKVVPRLSDGLQMALFMIPDPAITPYVSHKLDPTQRNAGAILCDETYRILGLNREAMGTLKIDDTLAKEEILCNTSIFEVFPRLNEKGIIEAALRKEGVVIAAPKPALQIGREYDDQTAALIMQDEGERVLTASDTLIWIRIIPETYGELGKAFVLVMAEIMQASRDKYVMRKDLLGVYENTARRWNETAGIVRPIRPTTESEASGNKELEVDNWQRISNDGSMMSVAVTTSENSEETNIITGLSHELNLRNVVGKQTPSSIIRLYVVIVGLLVVITVLITINAIVAINAANQLMERFDLIKAYLMRYKVNMAIASAEKSYATNIKKSKSVFDALLGRIAGRLNILANYNEQTRKLLFAQNLNYDMEDIVIPDLHTDSRTVQFSHSVLVFTNAVSDFMSYGYYDSVSICATKPELWMCTYITSMIAYSFELAFMPMRNKQDEVSARMQKELDVLATEDETTQYILVCVCIGLVAASAAVIVPIFIKVIQDKSYVFAIFSYISPEEIATVISESKKLDVKRIRFKKSWVRDFADQQEVFWRKLLAGNHRKKPENSRHNLRNKEESRDSLVSKGLESKGALESDIGLTKPVPPGKGKDSDKSLPTKQESMGEEKENARAKQLSEIDYDLRNKSIVRLIFSVMLFLAYGGASIYFNHYVHSVNSEAVSMFFVYHNRAIYAASTALFLKEAITSGNKVLVSKSSGDDGNMYLMDVVERLHTIEGRCQDFAKRASDSIYGNFLALQARAETDQFCAVSDSYNYSQTLPCSELYTGPAQQGVSAGMAYLIDFYTQYAVKITNANYSDPAVATVMKNDPNPALFTNGVIVYMNPILEYLMLVFYDDAKSFFKLAKKIVYVIAFCFLGVFSATYLFIFINFVGTLNKEIRQTREIVNMIPLKVLKGNPKVREQVWNHKGIN